MKLKDVFISHIVNGEQLTVSLDSSVFSGLVRSNSTAAFIIDCLRSDTDRDGILSAMLEKYSGDPALMSEDIDMVISKLRDIGALEE